VRPSAVFTVNGVRVGVIGAELKNTPELVSAGATAGLSFLDEAPRIQAESERLRKRGVKVQVVVIHQGTNVGANPIGNAPASRGRGRSLTSPTPCRAPRSTRSSPVTRTGSRT
jgi:2',3'-cyclic-nucleotide 2'-phosphodiesterase (5'-nucleotidase family)